MSYITKLTTGKTWCRYFQRINKAGEPIPFAITDTLRAQAKESPAIGGITFAMTAEILDYELAVGKISFTDEQTMLIPTARSFAEIKLLYFDVDCLTLEGEVEEIIVNAKLMVTAGVMTGGIV